MLEIHHDWGQVVPTIFPNSYTSVWIVFVSKHSCNAEASSQQSIGAHSRTSEGVSISLWTTWLRVTSPAPGDWWRKGSIKPSCYSSSSSSSTTPNQTTYHPQTRWLSDCFPRPVQTSWRELSRLSDHLHHRQFSQLQTNNYSLYTLLIRMDLSSLRCRATWGEETTTWIEFCWFPSYQNTRGHAGHQHRVRGHAVHCSGDWGPEEKKKKPKREMHWIGYINIFATIWISILVVHMYGRHTS